MILKIIKRRLKGLFAAACLVWPCTWVWGQGEVGLILGISNYQGDLASYSTQNGFRALIGPVAGIHTGYALSNYFKVRADVLYTRISGDDALNDSPVTRARNLNFYAPVVQFNTGIDWSILGFSVDDKSAFSPYVSVGAGIFYFNPMTEYEGRKVALQPLGTEGQYLEDYPDQKPYSRFQPCLQFGGGLKFLTSDRLILGIEAMLTYTFTDYLDDASTIYITYSELLEKAGPLTAALANRQGELLGTEPVITPTGSRRANPDSNDYFGVITLRASMPVDIQSNRFKVRRHHNKKMNCPKF